MTESKVTLVNDNTVVIKKSTGRVAVIRSVKYVAVVHLDVMSEANKDENLVMLSCVRDDDYGTEDCFKAQVSYLLIAPEDSQYFLDPPKSWHYNHGDTLTTEEIDEIKFMVQCILPECYGEYKTFQGHRCYKNENGIYTFNEAFKLDWKKVRKGGNIKAKFGLLTANRGGAECPVAIALNKEGAEYLEKLCEEFPVAPLKYVYIGANVMQEVVVDDLVWHWEKYRVIHEFVEKNNIDVETLIKVARKVLAKSCVETAEEFAKVVSGTTLLEDAYNSVKK